MTFTYRQNDPNGDTFGEMLSGPNDARDEHDALTEALEQVGHRHLNLGVGVDGGGCHRPDLTIWPAVIEDIEPAVVTLKVGAMHGQQLRYVDMTPDEARTLAGHLVALADLIDREVDATTRTATP